jgi:FlaA1/EpsC-like NDP-sugar epimerase
MVLIHMKMSYKVIQNKRINITGASRILGEIIMERIWNTRVRKLFDL